MITHQSCGHEMGITTLRYYPLRADVAVGVLRDNRLYDRDPHTVTQIYKRIGTANTLPQLHCAKCDEFFDLEEFDLTFSCQHCGATDFQYSMHTPQCSYFSHTDLICENCIVTACMVTCKRKCHDYVYAYEKFGRALEKLHTKYLKEKNHD